MDENSPTWEAEQALRTARERMQGGDEWSAGYEVGRAFELLKRFNADEDETD